MQRAHAWLAVAAVALMSGGAALASVGAGYVASWISFEQRLRAVLPSAACGLCPQQLTRFLVAPDPRPVFLAYLLAMPMGMVSGYLLYRAGRRVRSGGSPQGTVLRMTGGVLAGTMAGMALFFGTALVGATLGPLDLGILRTAYFVGLLLVPSLVVGAGGALLVEAVSRHLTGRTPIVLG